ncbi:MAG: hypothetical protein BalsKO_16400 [Balneolaceae bacterium]
MFKRVSKKLLVLGLFASGLFLSTPAQAQLEEIEAFLNSGADNANALTQAYLSPLATGLSTTFNSGWTTKAAPTKKLGFSIQIRTAFAAVPSSAQLFDASTLGLSNVNVTGTSSNTISGSKGNGQTISSTDPGNVFSFDLPGGTGFNYVPAAMLQANVGLIKGTDITARYIPETALGDFGNISLIGFGIKHGLNQWIPGGKLLPVDISLMAAFSQVDLNADLEFNTGATDQVVETSTNTFVFNALVGKTLPFVSAYAGVGYQTGSFELNMLGDYQIGTGVASTTISDPVSYKEDSEAGVHALAGLQFKIAILRIYAEATLAEYATVNAGIGIGFRN